MKKRLIIFLFLLLTAFIASCSGGSKNNISKNTLPDDETGILSESNNLILQINHFDDDLYEEELMSNNNDLHINIQIEKIKLVTSTNKMIEISPIVKKIDLNHPNNKTLYQGYVKPDDYIGIHIYFKKNVTIVQDNVSLNYRLSEDNKLIKKDFNISSTSSSTINISMVLDKIDSETSSISFKNNIIEIEKPGKIEIEDKIDKSFGNGMVKVLGEENSLFSPIIMSAIKLENVEQNQEYFQPQKNEIVLAAYEMEPDTVFKKPVDVTFQINDGLSQIDSLKKGYFRVYYYHKGKDKWFSVPIINNQAASGSITIRTRHFTQFKISFMEGIEISHPAGVTARINYSMLEKIINQYLPLQLPTIEMKDSVPFEPLIFESPFINYVNCDDSYPEVARDEINNQKYQNCIEDCKGNSSCKSYCESYLRSSEWDMCKLLQFFKASVYDDDSFLSIDAQLNNFHTQDLNFKIIPVDGKRIQLKITNKPGKQISLGYIKKAYDLEIKSKFKCNKNLEKCKSDYNHKIYDKCNRKKWKISRWACKNNPDRAIQWGIAIGICKIEEKACEKYLGFLGEYEGAKKIKEELIAKEIQLNLIFDVEKTSESIIFNALSSEELDSLPYENKITLKGYSGTSGEQSKYLYPLDENGNLIEEKVGKEIIKNEDKLNKEIGEIINEQITEASWHEINQDIAKILTELTADLPPNIVIADDNKGIAYTAKADIGVKNIPDQSFKCEIAPDITVPEITSTQFPTTSDADFGFGFSVILIENLFAQMANKGLFCYTGNLPDANIDFRGIPIDTPKLFYIGGHTIEIQLPYQVSVFTTDEVLIGNESATLKLRFKFLPAMGLNGFHFEFVSISQFGFSENVSQYVEKYLKEVNKFHEEDPNLWNVIFNNVNPITYTNFSPSMMHLEKMSVKNDFLAFEYRFQGIQTNTDNQNLEWFWYTGEKGDNQNYCTSIMTGKLKQSGLSYTFTNEDNHLFLITDYSSIPAQSLQNAVSSSEPITIMGECVRNYSKDFLDNYQDQFILKGIVKDFWAFQPSTNIFMPLKNQYAQTIDRFSTTPGLFSLNITGDQEKEILQIYNDNGSQKLLWHLDQKTDFIGPGRQYEDDIPEDLNSNAIYHVEIIPSTTSYDKIRLNGILYEIEASNEVKVTLKRATKEQLALNKISLNTGSFSFDNIYSSKARLSIKNIKNTIKVEDHTIFGEYHISFNVSDVFMVFTDELKNVYRNQYEYSTPDNVNNIDNAYVRQYLYSTAEYGGCYKGTGSLIGSNRCQRFMYTYCVQGNSPITNRQLLEKGRCSKYKYLLKPFSFFPSELIYDPIVNNVNIYANFTDYQNGCDVSTASNVKSMPIYIANTPIGKRNPEKWGDKSINFSIPDGHCGLELEFQMKTNTRIQVSNIELYRVQ